MPVNRIDHDQAGMSVAAGKGDSILFRVILRCESSKGYI